MLIEEQAFSYNGAAILPIILILWALEMATVEAVAKLRDAVHAEGLARDLEKHLYVSLLTQLSNFRAGVPGNPHDHLTSWIASLDSVRQLVDSSEVAGVLCGITPPIFVKPPAEE